MSGVRDIIVVAVEEARGPVVLDRSATSPPELGTAYAQALAGLDAQGNTFHIFVPGFDMVGDPEAVIGGAY
jgi:hypothetical protein